MNCLLLRLRFAKQQMKNGHEALTGIEESAAFSNLSELVRGWGGELSVSSDGAQFSLTLSGSAESLQRIEQLLSAGTLQ